MSAALFHRGPQGPGGDAFATADDLAVGNTGKQMRRIGIGVLQRAAEACLTRELAIERCDARSVRAAPEIFQHGECRALALQLGDIGAADAGAVTGQVNARHARPSGGIALRKPLPEHGIECKSAARQIGKLRLAAQPERRADGIARDAMLGPGRVAPPQAADPSLTFHAERANVGANGQARSDDCGACTRDLLRACRPPQAGPAPASASRQTA